MNIQTSPLHLQNHELLPRARLLQAANQVGRQIAAVRNLNSLLSEAVETICEVYGFCCARIFLIDESGRWAVLRAEGGQVAPAEDQKLRIEGDTAVGIAISSHEAHILPRGGQDPAYARDTGPSDMCSKVALPLIVGDQVLGAVTVHSIEENAFEDDDVIPLQTMANYVAMAIHNAQLFQQLETTHAELLRTKTFEAIATTTGEALHWVGNKAAPIPGSADRVREGMSQWLAIFQALLAEPPETRQDHPFWHFLQASFNQAAGQNIDLAAIADQLATSSPQQLSDLAGLDSILEDLEIIQQSAGTILSIKEDLVGPMRVQQMAAIELPALLRRTITGMSLPDGVVRTAFAENLPLVRGDPRQIEQVFNNLIKNAWEALYGHPEPYILVSVQRVSDPGFVLVQVQDNGPGIPLELLDKIWVSFFTTKGDRGGTGLGLSACMEIITQTGGKIWLDSSQPGVGTTFAVLLPVSPE